MNRMIKILSVVGLSSVYLMQGACQISGNGISIIPSLTTTTLKQIFPFLPI